MFDTFFNLRENPFGLNPNPKFFFLNKVHSDAMKYLIFGIKNQEGFIEVLGEAGTGKTLMCLMLLYNLGDEAKSVFFLNPPGSENELLKKVVHDLNLGDDLKSREDMIEAIREFTIQESSQEHNIVFLFDEAQHLSYEILENIRLLTNAPEIKRPIQVILVGQPELEKKLCAHSQLRQRITLRFRLKPLTKKEVPEYINFRVKQARPSRNIIFPRGALRLIFQFSNGNPRLVNVICEKAILAASLNQTSTITPKLIQAVLKSTLDIDKPFLTPRRMAFAALFFAFVAISGFMWKFQDKTDLPAIKKKISATSEVIGNITSSVVSSYKKALEKTPFDENGIMRIDKDKGNYDLASLVTLLNNLDVKGIDKNLIKEWKKIKPDDFSFKNIAFQYGMEIANLKTSLEELRKFNTPVILLNVYDNHLGRKCSVVLTHLDKDQAEILHPGRGKETIETKELNANWKGKAIVIWRNTGGLPSHIISSSYNDKRVLKNIWRRLKKHGYTEGIFPQDSNEVEASLKKALMEFQKKNGLKPDGLIGTRTKIFLYASQVK